MSDRPLWAWELWAPRYENLVAQPFSLKPTRELVLRRVVEACPKARRILDVGCGVGQLARALAEALPDAHVTGVDPTGPMIARARADYGHPRVTYVNGTVFDVAAGEGAPDAPGATPCPGGFDAVVTTHAFPYVREPGAFLARIRDLLAPGGRLFLAQACAETWWDAAFLRIVKLTTGPAMYHPSRDIERMMMEAGLHPDGVRPVPTLPLVPALRLVEAVK